MHRDIHLRHIVWNLYVPQWLCHITTLINVFVTFIGLWCYSMVMYHCNNYLGLLMLNCFVPQCLCCKVMFFKSWVKLQCSSIIISYSDSYHGWLMSTMVFFSWSWSTMDIVDYSWLHFSFITPQRSIRVLLDYMFITLWHQVMFDTLRCRVMFITLWYS